MNKKHFYFLVALMAGLTLAIGIAFSAARAGTALLSLDPQTTIRGPGETVSMTIHLESGTLASGVDIYLTYDPAILLVLDADTLTDTVQIYPGTCPDPEFIIQNQANILSGTINYAAVDLGIDAGCTSGEVATIEFQCVGLGTSNVAFGPETELSDPEGITITLTTQNAAITCTDVTSTPGPSATPTPTLTPTPTAIPEEIYFPILRKDFTPTPTSLP
ncbi:MAG: hypothetical protein Fur0022_09770 [Anaerolineales bacterium]